MLPKSEVLKAIKRQKPAKIPVWYDYFANETRVRYADRLPGLLAQYPDDLAMCFLTDHNWGVAEEHAELGVGTQVKEPVIRDWEDLPLYLDPKKDINGIMDGYFPDFNSGDIFKGDKFKKEYIGDGFVVGAWWRAFFERLHYLRNMENAFADLILEENNVELLMDRVEHYLKGIVDRFSSEVGVDAIFFGDDIGMQDRLMMSPDTFRTVFKKRYRNMIDYCHGKNILVGMHTCGNIEEIIPDFIDIGLDILHPLQPHSVDVEKVVPLYGKDITFFAGVDVQYLLPTGTPSQIDEELKKMFKLFSKNDGFLITFANTVMPETPFENIEAAFKAISKYSQNVY